MYRFRVILNTDIDPRDEYLEYCDSQYANAPHPYAAAEIVADRLGLSKYGTHMELTMIARGVYRNGLFTICWPR